MAPRAGFEPATIRLTVECSTAELPRNRRNPRGRDGERITKPSGLAKEEIGRSDAASRAGVNLLYDNDLLTSWAERESREERSPRFRSSPAPRTERQKDLFPDEAR